MVNDAIGYVPQTRLPLVPSHVECDDAAITRQWQTDWKQDVRRRLGTCGLRSFRANVIATALMLAGLAATLVALS